MLFSSFSTFRRFWCAFNADRFFTLDSWVKWISIKSVIMNIFFWHVTHCQGYVNGRLIDKFQAKVKAKAKARAKPRANPSTSSGALQYLVEQRPQLSMASRIRPDGRNIENCEEFTFITPSASLHFTAHHFIPLYLTLLYFISLHTCNQNPAQSNEVKATANDDRISNWQINWKRKRTINYNPKGRSGERSKSSVL